MTDIKNLKDLKPGDTSIQCLVIGESGAGKSSFAASFPQPIRLLAPDKGLLTYRDTDTDASEYDLDAKSWIPFTKDVEEFLTEQHTKPEGFKEYATLIIDSTSTLSDIAMAYVLMKNGLAKPGWPEYGEVKDLIWGVMRKILSVKCNVIIISHVQYDRDELTSKVTATPLLNGKLALKFPSLFDEVYYAESVDGKEGKTEYRILTSPTGVLKARSRISGRESLLPQYIPNDYKHLKEAMQKVKG